ncbi:MAG TPA: winged helix-turn-helix domain-containing protein [Actinomycetota bacterium]
MGTVITRVFRGTVRPGQHAEFERLFREEAVPRFETTPGCLSVHFGTPTEASPDEYLVVTVWENVESLKAFAGERWSDPKLSLREAHVLSDATVHHYRNGDGEAIVPPASAHGGGPPAEVLDLGRLRVDLARRVAELDGGEVELPPQEFSVLAELALRAGEPVPSDELARLVWPEDAWPTGEDVRRSVYRLRRLLGDQGRARPLIRTRRGHGYVLDPGERTSPRHRRHSRTAARA